MADNTPDIIVARSLGGLLGGLLRQRAYWARWLGLNVQADLDRSHQLAAFAGRRRGGTACTSGVCYLVPDFRGVEVRLSSRF